MSFLLKAGLTLLTIGMLNAFGWVGSAVAAHCATIIKISPETDALGTESAVPSPHHTQQEPQPNAPKFHLPFDVQPSDGSCSTESGPVRTLSASGQLIVVTARIDLFTPDHIGRMPIPTDLIVANTSTSAIFEPPRL